MIEKNDGNRAYSSRFLAGVLALTSFLFSFNYFVLRTLKESFLITAPQAGAEAIPFVKSWCLLPLSILFLAAFTSLAKRISLRFAVNVMVLFFLASYALFAFVCLPFAESLQLDRIADWMTSVLPRGWHSFASVVRYWSYSLFYVTAESWGTLIYSVVFWGYANAVVNFSDAKKYYSYLTLGGTVGTLMAGFLTVFLTGPSLQQWIPDLENPWRFSFYSLITLVVASGTFSVALFQYFCPSAVSTQTPQNRTTLTQSIAQVFRSKHLITLALICFCINYILNLTDVMWKSEILKTHVNPRDFTAYLSRVTFIMGIVSTLLALFVCRPLMRQGWTRTAIVTPLIALVTAAPFFSALYGGVDLWLLTPLLWGSLHICLTCSARYTLFEPAKEMALIPLPQEEKLHGKAIIDGFCAKTGRMSSSITYQFLLVFAPSITACSPFIAVIVMGAILAVCTGMFSLGRHLDAERAQVKSV